MFPRVEDFTKNPEIYALPMLLYRYVAGCASVCRQGLGSGCRFGSEHHAAAAVREVLRRASCGRRGRLFVVRFVHYLTYYMIFEYQYGTLVPVLPRNIRLWRRERRVRPAPAADDFLCRFSADFPADPQFSRADRSQPILGRQLPPSGGTGCGRFPVSGVLRRGTRLAGRVSMAFRAVADQIWPISRSCLRGWRAAEIVLLVASARRRQADYGSGRHHGRARTGSSTWRNIAGDVSPRVRGALHCVLARCYSPTRPTSPSNTTT